MPISMQVPFWHHEGPMMGWHWGWGLFWLVLTLLVVWGVARAVSSGGRTSAAPGEGDAEEALRRRFAEGRSPARSSGSV
jgi:uncharacterized membrane protein